MGINVTSSGSALMAASKLDSMPPVIMPDTISTNSHNMRFLLISNTLVLR